MGSLKQVLALVFKRKGKGILSDNEFVFSASIDFRWYTPKEAQQILDMGLNSGLLERTNGFIKPTFDYKKVDIPLDFHPGKEVLVSLETEVEGPLFPRMLDSIAKNCRMGRREVVSRINKVQERLCVDIEVAALVVARDLGMVIDTMIPPVRDEIASR